MKMRDAPRGTRLPRSREGGVDGCPPARAGPGEMSPYRGLFSFRYSQPAFFPVSTAEDSNARTLVLQCQHALEEHFPCFCLVQSCGLVRLSCTPLAHPSQGKPGNRCLLGSVSRRIRSTQRRYAGPVSATVVGVMVSACRRGILGPDDTGSCHSGMGLLEASTQVESFTTAPPGGDPRLAARRGPSLSRWPP